MNRGTAFTGLSIRACSEPPVIRSRWLAASDLEPIMTGGDWRSRRKFKGGGERELSKLWQARTQIIEKRAGWQRDRAWVARGGGWWHRCNHFTERVIVLTRRVLHDRRAVQKRRHDEVDIPVERRGQVECEKASEGASERARIRVSLPLPHGHPKASNAQPSNEFDIIFVFFHSLFEDYIVS